MSLSKAIQTRDKGLLKETVAKAVKTYKAKKPDEPKIETCYGPMNVSMVAAMDKKSFWSVAAQAYTDIVNTPIEEGTDREIEIAKLIATNPILRALTDDSKQDKDSLL